MEEIRTLSIDMNAGTYEEDFLLKLNINERTQENFGSMNDTEVQVLDDNIDCYLNLT